MAEKGRIFPKVMKNPSLAALRGASNLLHGWSRHPILYLS